MAALEKIIIWAFLTFAIISIVLLIDSWVYAYSKLAKGKWKAEQELHQIYITMGERVAAIQTLAPAIKDFEEIRIQRMLLDRENWRIAKKAEERTIALLKLENSYQRIQSILQAHPKLKLSAKQKEILKEKNRNEFQEKIHRMQRNYNRQVEEYNQIRQPILTKVIARIHFLPKLPKLHLPKDTWKRKKKKK